MGPEHMLSYIFLTLLTLEATSSLSNHPKLIVISFDGFRYDYLQKCSTPALNRLIKEGTHAEHMYNVFPTKTFVNHHTMATGLYPESHNIIGNKVFDKKTNRVLGVKDPEMYSTPGVTPIWVLNQLSGNGRHSGVSMWPGSTHTFQNTTPDFYLTWNRSMPWEARVDKVLEWFQDPVQPANLALMYFEEPDTTSHFFGPYNPKTLVHVKQVDDIVGYLQQKLDTLNLRDQINIVLVSDHGLTEVTPQRTYNITGLLNGATVVDSSPVFQIYPKEGDENNVYNALKKASCSSRFSVYRPQEILERWHYRNSIRVPPILLLADLNYAFQDIVEWYSQEYPRKLGIQLTPTTTVGVHGYDNKEKEMWPIFIASGPQVKVGHKVEPFNTVDLYSFFSAILGIKPGHTDGTLAQLKDALRTLPTLK